MLKITQVRERRSTLDPKNIVSSRTVKISKYSNERRLFSLSKAQRDELPWIAPLLNRNTWFMQLPKPLSPQQAKSMKLKCENDLTEIEEQDQTNTEAQKFQTILNDPNFKTQYISLPIIDSNTTEECKNRFSFQFSQPPPPLRFVHITGTNGDLQSSGLPSSVYMDLFVYTKGVSGQSSFPVTESIRTTFSQHKPVFQAGGKNSDNFFFPFLDTEEARLVCVIYRPSLDPDEVAGSPIVVGFQKINELKNEESLSFVWCSYDHSLSFCQHFDKKSNMPNIKLNFIGKIVEDKNETDNVARLTAFDSAYPTPLLTISDVRLNLKQKYIPKKDAGNIYFSVCLKDSQQHVHELFMKPNQEGKLESLGFSSQFIISEIVNFPDNMNFLMNPSITDDLTINFEIIYNDISKSKSKQLFQASFPLNKPSDLINKNFDQNSSIHFRYLFPTVVAPPDRIRKPLFDSTSKPDTSDHMYIAIAPYVLMSNLTLLTLPHVDFANFFDLLPLGDMQGIQSWIEQYFSCEPKFSAAFIKKMIQYIDIISEWPVPFFLILYKALCIDKKLDNTEIDGLLTTCAKFCIVNKDSARRKTEALKASVGDFLVQLRMFFDHKVVEKISYNFLAQLPIMDRFDVYKYLFADIAFLQSLTMQKMINFNTPMSPHIPLFSLFFTSVNQAFLANDKDSIRQASSVLIILATTVEQYSDQSNTLPMATALFPLLPIIYTFYDSLIQQLEDRSVITPIILFIIKNCVGGQFLQYYNILSLDNQLRILDFLVSLSDIKTIEEISSHSLYMKENSLVYALEVTWRILMFLCFFEEVNEVNEQILRSIFNLLLHMLQSTKQPSESFGIIFKSMSFFVRKFAKTIFVEVNDIITQILTAIVPHTQWKLLHARTSALGFILWLINQETKFRPATTRCNLALQYAFVSAFFKTEKFVPFFDILPSSFKSLEKLHKKLVSARDCKYHVNKINKLLKIYKEFTNFLSIRALIYANIVVINKKEDDRACAFNTQWRLCALIAEAFKLKKQIVDGIPEAGAEGFQFVENEPKVDLSKYPEDSQFIVLQSEMFSEHYMNSALQETLDLCQKVQLHRLIGSLTIYLFNFLEKRREFVRLQKLYENVSNSFVSLSKNEKPLLEFYRIFLSGAAAKFFKVTEAIYMSTNQTNSNGEIVPITTFNDLINKYTPDTKLDKTNIPLNKSDDNVAQIIKVKCIKSELFNLESKTFETDVIGDVKGWDEDCVTRYRFITKTPLPGCTSIVPISESTATNITRHSYYLENLNKYYEILSKKIDSIQAVLPPPKMKPLWANCVLGISSSPILQLLCRITNAKEDDKNHTYYWFVRAHHLNNLDIEGVPDDIIKISDSIWNVCVQTVHLIDQVHDLIKPSPADQVLLTKCRETLGIPETPPKVAAN